MRQLLYDGRVAPIGAPVYTVGPWSRRVRLASGTILFLYVTLHLINHALGNVGLGAMQAMLSVQLWIWQGLLGSILLYGAFLVHGGLGVAAFYRRRLHGMTWLEAAQLVLGLAIPALLFNHLADTRLALLVYGIPKRYPQVLATFWVLRPLFGWLQVTVLIVAWAHGCIGMHSAFRLKRWYGEARQVLLVVAILVPVLALLGFAEGAREVARDMALASWRAIELAPDRVGSAADAARLFGIRNLAIIAYISLLALVAVLRGLRSLRERRVAGIAVSYPDGRVVLLPPGGTVLEGSRRLGYPHASICGGRGRCSTCRVRVLGQAELPPPAASETAVLVRVGADPARIRLACQLRPLADIGVYPLVPPPIAGAFTVGASEGKLGEERFIVAMFVDLRDSTALLGNRLPYDAVFLLRRFVETAAAAIVTAGGVANQFTGDGVLALFGLYSEPETACRAALAAAGQVAAALARTEHAAAEGIAREAFNFGIGAHCGPAIVGEIAFGDSRTFTALGEVVHLSARFEQASRDLGHAAVISADIFRHAGQVAPEGSAREITARGHDRPLTVHLLSAEALRNTIGADRAR